MEMERDAAKRQGEDCLQHLKLFFQKEWSRRRSHPVIASVVKKSVSFRSGENIKVDTLLWIPPAKPPELIRTLVENLGLELDGQGYVKTDEKQETNVKGLFAAGDVRGVPSRGALAATYDGGIAGTMIIHEWYS